MGKGYSKESQEGGVSLSGKMIKWWVQEDSPLKPKLVQACMTTATINVQRRLREILRKL